MNLFSDASKRFVERRPTNVMWHCIVLYCYDKTCT